MSKTKLAVAGTIILFLFLGLGNLFAQSAEDSKFQKLLENYLDEYWKFYPNSRYAGRLLQVQ
jgi:amino acid permease